MTKPMAQATVSLSPNLDLEHALRLARANKAAQPRLLIGCDRGWA